MVISIEPGIYIESIGGFRHSDTVLVTGNGCVSLTGYPDSLGDLTLPDSIKPEGTGETISFNDGLTIIGAPVYAGRVAPVAAERIRQFKADGIPAVLVVIYGNREFEDALRELKDLAIEVGFRPIAGGAFIGEHSYADSKFSIARQRPDQKDLKKCSEFGALIKEKIQQVDSIDRMVVGKLQQKKGTGDIL